MKIVEWFSFHIQLLFFTLKSHITRRAYDLDFLLRYNNKQLGIHKVES